MATLMNQGLVTLNRVAEDGMRVRASAGASSFRRQETLEKHLAAAREQVTRLKEELEQDPGTLSRRQKAAQERAARVFAERVAQRDPHVRQPRERSAERRKLAWCAATEGCLGRESLQVANTVEQRLPRPAVHESLNGRFGRCGRNVADDGRLFRRKVVEERAW